MFDLDLNPILLGFCAIRNRTYSCPVTPGSPCNSKVRESPAFPFARLARTHRVPVIGSALVSVIRPSGVWSPTC
jgi:hypothetical protein